MSPGDGTADVVLVGPQGRSDRYTPAGNGNYTPPAGVYTTLQKNNDNTYLAHPQGSLHLDLQRLGRLLPFRIAYGNAARLTYDDGGRLASVSDPAGRGSLNFAYDTATGRLSSVNDWAGRVVRYAYDSNGRLNRVTDREGQVTTYAYDGSSSRLTTITDANGHVAVTNVYDSQGRVSTQKDARGLSTGELTSFTYAANADGTKTTTVTYPSTSFDPNWRHTEIDTYDNKGRITQHVSRPTANSAEWITKSFSYDGASNLASVRDGRGNTTTFCYDVDYGGSTIAGGRGNLTRRIDSAPTPGGPRPTTLYKYDAKDNLIQTISPKGVNAGASVDCSTDLRNAVVARYATDSTYDAETQTKLVLVTQRYTDPELGLQTAVTKYQYADASNPGLMTAMVPPRGNAGPNPDLSYATTYVYFSSGSAAGLLQQVTTPLGGKTTYEYDAAGRIIKMVGPNGNAVGAVPAAYTWDTSTIRKTARGSPKRRHRLPGGLLWCRKLAMTQSAMRSCGSMPMDKCRVFCMTSAMPWRRCGKVRYRGQIRLRSRSQDHHAIRLRPLGQSDVVTRSKGDSVYERVTDYAYDGLTGFGRRSSTLTGPALRPP